MIHSRTNMAILVPEGALKTIGEKNDKRIDAFGYEISAHDTGMHGDEAGTGQEGIMRDEIGRAQSSLMSQSFMVTERSSESDETQRMMSSSVQKREIVFPDPKRPPKTRYGQNPGKTPESEGCQSDPVQPRRVFVLCMTAISMSMIFINLLKIIFEGNAKVMMKYRKSSLRTECSPEDSPFRGVATGRSGFSDPQGTEGDREDAAIQRDADCRANPTVRVAPGSLLRKPAVSTVRVSPVLMKSEVFRSPGRNFLKIRSIAPGYGIRGGDSLLKGGSGKTAVVFLPAYTENRSLAEVPACHLTRTSL